MDALAHAVECCTNNACQPISRALAIDAVTLIGLHLRSAVLNGGNIESRYQMMLASTMAGIAMNPTRLGLAHALAMPLGSWDLHIPHGVVLAILLPHCWSSTISPSPTVSSSGRALGQPVDGLSPLEGARSAVEAVRALARDVGIPDTMTSYGLQERHIRPVVEEAMKSGNIAVNPRKVTAADVERILRAVL